MIPPIPDNPTTESLEAWIKSIDWDSMIAEDDGDGSTFVDTGISGVVCTGYAQALVNHCPERIKRWGWYNYENPASSIGDHDIAVLDERWILDYWVTQFHTQNVDRSVYDLRSDSDRSIISKLYGQIHHWTPGP